MKITNLFFTFLFCPWRVIDWLTLWATFDGNDGVVKVGANTVAEVTQFSVTEGIQTKDDTAMGDTSDTHKTGRKNWNGSLTCWWDDTDTNGQEALVIGASVTLHLHPEGSASGADDITGTASITEVTVTSEKDGIVTRSFNFLGNGTLTHGTVV